MLGINNKNNNKQNTEEVVKMKNILKCMIFVLVAFFATNALAATSQSVNVSATVPTMTGGLSVAISRVVNTVWTPNQTSISFGTLTWDPTNSIFLAPAYYAVDVGVTDNSGTAWTVTHTRSSLARTGGGNLDNKVNVTFMKQTSSTVATQLQKVSYGNSNNVAYTKAQLSGGWLRIYYGVGTGDPADPDAPGVTPIGLDTAAGTYNGSITITLTP
ncbi:MAG: hypothetical protein PHY35_02995 [Candidatus Omnitrophica bacterium]|nr:hypothetical protein [Candidatus Omnitrophota bacterium]